MSAVLPPSPSVLPPALLRWRSQARARWLALVPRERRAVLVALTLVVAFAGWKLAIAPALRTLREAPVQLARLDAELLRMRAMAAEAAELRGATPVSDARAAEALIAATARLGAGAGVTVQGPQATLRLTGVDAEALRLWLGEARSVARARPVSMQLTRGTQGLSGTVVVAIGAGA